MRTIDLARAVELSTQQVRNYEAYGFLPPVDRSTTGYRLYTPRHLDALKTARSMIAGYGWMQALAIMQATHRGDLDAALALVDARHAELDRKRQQVNQTLEAIHVAAPQMATWTSGKQSRGLRVSEAARLLGVRVSSVHYWEYRGLLRPTRQQSNRYRFYDDQQMQRLQVIVLLREVGYDFATLQSVLEEMSSGRPERVLEALENRREEIRRASRACTQATAALWNYVSQDT